LDATSKVKEFVGCDRILQAV